MRSRRHIVLFMLLLSLLVSSNVAAQGKRRQPRRSNKALASSTKSRPTNLTRKLSPAQEAAASNALKALRRLTAATEMGVKYDDYKRLVVEGISEVGEALAALPEGELGDQIHRSMDGYVAVDVLWTRYIDYQKNGIMTPRPGSLGASLLEGDRLRGKEIPFALSAPIPRKVAFRESEEKVVNIVKYYSLPSVTREKFLIVDFDDVTSIWGIARQHLDRASELLYR
jgi:hypothetical protein